MKGKLTEEQEQRKDPRDCARKQRVLSKARAKMVSTKKLEKISSSQFGSEGSAVQRSRQSKGNVEQLGELNSGAEGTRRKIGQHVDEMQMVKFLQESGAIPQGVPCIKCGKPMTLCRDLTCNIGCKWRCYKRTEGRRCSYGVSVLTGTMFEKSRLGLLNIAKITCLWLQGHIDDTIRQEAGIMFSSNALIGWKRKLREHIPKDDHKSSSNWRPGNDR